MFGNTTRGLFITLEGGEGTGKSTQAQRLAERLRDMGVRVLTTREPGGTPGAEAIRDLLVNGEVRRWEPMSEALLHFAARVDHVEKVIRPALAQGQWVISDRFADSTFAYQGAGQGLSAAAIADLYRLSLDGFAPDLTLILDMPVAEALARARQRGGADRYERMGPAFHERLRAAFLDIAATAPERCRVIAAGGPPDEVAARLWAVVAKAVGA